jgi:hypothetical protein
MLYTSFTAATGVSFAMLLFAGVSPADSILQLFMNNFDSKKQQTARILLRTGPD